MSKFGRGLPLSLGLLVCGLVGIVACTPLDTTPVQSQPGTTTTIIMVRHAERNEGLDPPLNEEGQARAEALANALSENGVTAIYAIDLIRNRDTAQPLADRLGLTIHLITQVEALDTKAVANNFVNEVLADHAGGTVLFVGNIGPVNEVQSGNLQELYARLGGTIDPPTFYEDLYMALIPEEGPVRFVKAAYGGPSSLDP